MSSPYCSTKALYSSCVSCTLDAKAIFSFFFFSVVFSFSIFSLSSTLVEVNIDLDIDIDMLCFGLFSSTVETSSVVIPSASVVLGCFGLFWVVSFPFSVVFFRAFWFPFGAPPFLPFAWLRSNLAAFISNRDLNAKKNPFAIGSASSSGSWSSKA